MRNGILKKTISVTDLRTKFPWIRKQLQRGVIFELTYRGKIIAELIPIKYR